MTTAPTLADFTDWLNRTQALHLEGMHTTTGDAFTAHLDVFSQVSTAINVVLRFNYAQIDAAQTSGDAA